MRASRNVDGRTSYRKVFLGVIIAVLAVGSLVWIGTMRRTLRLPAPAADDPCSLRLCYVRPDYDDEVYDAVGMPIGNVPAPLIRAHWKSSEMVRTIVFACHVEGDAPLFEPIVWLSLNGGPSRGVAWLQCTDSNDSWHTLSCRAAVPRTVRRPWFRFGPLRVQRSPRRVRTVDAEIRCFAGPRGAARATFAGPFRIGPTYRAQENAQTTLDITAQAGMVTLHLTGPPPMDSKAPIVLYLRDGQRLLADSRGGSTSSSGGFDWTVHQSDVTLADITHITIDETPQTQVFRNIVVDYPDRPQRTHPRSLDEIVARLDLDVNLKNEEAIDTFFSDRNFLKTPSDALRILDVAQSQQLSYAVETLQRAAPSDLSPEEQERLQALLETWLETGREIQACQLGLWAGWPRFIDHTVSLLRAGDLAEPALRHLARTWGQMAPAEPQTAKAMTELLLEKNIIDSSVFRALAYAVRRNPESNGPYIQALAECDKSWIWERIIQPDGPFRRWKQNRQLSETVRARAVALGLVDWVDDPESLESEARTILCSMLTPEYVQKGDIHRWVQGFEKLVPPEQGTPVLLRYLQRQEEQWHTWQLPGRTSRNPLGIRYAVQQLNCWHHTNLGGLGSDRTGYELAEYRFYWQDIIQEVLYWARTGRDPRKLPANWQPSEQDLRLAWHNQTDPERSVIAVWPARQDPNVPPTDTILESADDYLQFVLTGQTGTTLSDRVYEFFMRAGVSGRHSTGRRFTFTHRELPKALDPGPTNMFGTGPDGVRREKDLWEGSWRVWIESATAPKSVLEGTALFRAWREQFQSAAPAPRDRVFHIASEERP